MKGNRRNLLTKYSSPHFKRTGSPRRGKQHNTFSEEYSENFLSSDTVYRILCQSAKIGSVIGKGGSIVKALREETRAKITVSDSVPGSDERVITIFSPSDKNARRHSRNDGDKTKKEYDAIEPHCAAQDALLKVHNRIVEEDLHGVEKGKRDETVVSARLLVSDNAVGCLLGRKGDVIQRLRSETSANIRVLPSDHLAACAMRDDELVQISGKPSIVKKALFEVSSLLHQNPRKDNLSLSFPPPFDSHHSPYASEGFRHPGSPRNMLPPENPTWLGRNPDAHRMQRMPFNRGYATPPSAFERDDFDGGTPPHDWEAPTEFTIKILCSAEKTGSVIGKGGCNVRQLEKETGASIHVDDVSKESHERVIRVSSFEALWDQRSQTIDAILHLQNKTCDYSEDGTVTTKLLVASNKVGCLLGQGGHVINDMRRRTHADIQVFAKKEGKPKCALEDEELVQISGSFGIVKDALVEIASRLRTRCIRDANFREEPVSVRPLPGLVPARNLRGEGLRLSSTILPGSLRRYGHLQGGVREYEPPTFPVPPRATGYLDVDEAKFRSLPATAGSRISEFAGTRMNLRDRYSNGSDFGTSEHFNSPRHMYLRSGSLEHFNSPGNMYQSLISGSLAALNDYPERSAYQGYNSPRPTSPISYENSNGRSAAYQDKYTLQGSHPNIRSRGS